MVAKIIPNKALGQNFLTDLSIASLMVNALDVQENDQILEIGAGTGVVTKPLAVECNHIGARLVAVEFDINLMPILKSELSQFDNVKVVNANILNYLDDFPVTKDSCLKIIGSLPYNITSPLIHKLIKTTPMPTTCVFMIQKEVAQKICAMSPDSSYLSIFVQTFFAASILKIIPRTSFNPVPQVDGAVIKLEKNQIAYSDFDIYRYERFLHRIFAHPRKMLNKVFTKEELEKYQLDGTKRPQDYNTSDYLRIATL